MNQFYLFSFQCRLPWGRFLFLNRREAANKLTATFPAIKSLVIFDCLFDEIEIAQLLIRWRHTLTSLKLVVCDPSFNWEMMFIIIKKMPLLQHLSIFSNNGFTNPQPQLPFLGQLRTFQFAFFQHNGRPRQLWLSHLLRQLNPDVLQHVDVGIFTSETNRSPFFCYNLKQLLHERPAIAAKLRRLYFPSLSRTFCHFLVHQFPSVSWLDMELGSANDLKQISTLKGLKFLALRSNQLPYSDCPLDRASWQALAQINPMVSVTKLILFDFELQEGLLKKLFPNVITLEQYRRQIDNGMRPEEP